MEGSVESVAMLGGFEGIRAGAFGGFGAAVGGEFDLLVSLEVSTTRLLGSLLVGLSGRNGRDLLFLIVG